MKTPIGLQASVFFHYKPKDYEDNIRNDLALKEANANANANAKGRSLLSLQAMKERYMKMGGHEQYAGQHHNKQGQGVSTQVMVLSTRAMLPKDPDYKFNPNDEPGFSLRLAAQNGDVSPIEYLLGKDPNLIHEADKKGWQALHEAIRGGYLQVVKYLIEMGADVGSKTGIKDTPLMVARTYLPTKHAIIEYLLSVGAPES
eukprot:gene30284-39505_t